MKRIFLVLFLLILFSNSSLLTQQAPLPSDSEQISELIVLIDKTGDYSIGTYLDILEDKTGKQTFEEISEVAKHKISTRNEFERSVNSYINKEFDASKKLFQEIFQTNPEDTAAIIYIKRIEEHERFGLPVDWEPVNSLKSK